jgi:hypothetical protein
VNTNPARLSSRQCRTIISAVLRCYKVPDNDLFDVDGQIDPVLEMAAYIGSSNFL